MRIEKIENSTGLKTGQQLVVLNCSKFYGNATVCHLQQSVKSGLLKSYLHRQEPVPWISRPRNYRLFRHPRTTNERRAHFSDKATKEMRESYGVAFKLRRKRSSHWLPNSWDDLSLLHQRNWKEHRKTQRKNADGINRRFHSRPFWDW